MIETITPEMQIEIDEMIEREFENLTSTHDPSDVRQTVTDVWKQMGYDTSAVVLGEGPMECAVYMHIINTLYEDSLPKFIEKLSDYEEAGYATGCPSGRCAELHLQVSKNASLHGLRKSNSELKSVFKGLEKPARDKLNGQLYVSLFWRYWQCRYAAGKIAGVVYDEKLYDVFSRWCKHVPLIYAHPAIPVVSRNPTSVVWNDTRSVLHNEDGPSVAFNDGYKLWSIEGVSIDEQIVMQPETQTVEQIRGEQNEEVKRIRIERYGWPEYLEGINAELISENVNDIEGTKEKLYLADGQPVIICACPSTAKVFSLETPDNVKTCEDAQRFLSSGLSGRTAAAS